MNRFWKFLGNSLIVSALMSRAAAAMGVLEPARVDSDVWRNVRKEIGNDYVNPGLNVDFSDALLSSVDAGGNLHETILISYRSMPESDWGQLDSFWQDQKVIQTSAAGIQAFVEVRTSLDGANAISPNSLYENWVLRAHHKPGHYDNGGGND